MGMEDLINQLNQQYEEVDSKEDAKEEKIDLDEILKANEVTEKWLEEEREFQKNSKDDNFSKDAFTKERTRSRYEDKKEEKKEERKSSYSYYKSSDDDKKSSYSSRYSSSYNSSSKKSSDDIFYEKVESAFIDKINKMVDSAINKNLNRIEDEGEWDILDLQYELNRKRITDRDYEEKEITKEFNKILEKHSNSCSRKIDAAELLLLLKVNPYKY